MKTFLKKERIAVIFTLSLIVVSGISVLLTDSPFQNARTVKSKDSESYILDSIRVTISLPNDNSKLLPGFNYYLIREMSGKVGIRADIEYIPHSSTITGMLNGEKTDLLVLPLCDTSLAGKDFNYIVVDNLCIWMIREDDRHIEKKAGDFLAKFKKTGRYKSACSVYLKTYNPFRSGPRSALCPYDSLMKEEAKAINVDWRLLVAIAYQESHFRIEAGSVKGARGLMQMLPETGRKFGADDLLDPEKSIVAGGRFFQYLYKIFARANTEKDRINFTLASYNAGYGRIKEYRDLAREKGVDSGSWEVIRGLILSDRGDSLHVEPADTSETEYEDISMAELSDSLAASETTETAETADSLATAGEVETPAPAQPRKKRASFSYETLAYVKGVNAVYKEFCKIHPEQ